MPVVPPACRESQRRFAEPSATSPPGKKDPGLGCGGMYPVGSMWRTGDAAPWEPYLRSAARLYSLAACS